MSKPKFSVVIIAQKMNLYLDNCINKILENTYKSFEIIVVLDIPFTKHYKKTKFYYKKNLVSPAKKRDFGVKKAKGDIISFIDDDAYPPKNWLSQILKIFNKNIIAAVCGPGITPDDVTLSEKMSGWIISSPLGSGALRFRFMREKERFIDDFPSVNLSIRKEVFDSAGGFKTDFFPGEDTKLCHDIVYKLEKKIWYAPNIFVYHHRRLLLRPFLFQYGNYGYHRGFFIKVFPENSRRFIYFMPSLLVISLSLYLLFNFLSNHYSNGIINLILIITYDIMFFYLILLLLNSIWIIRKSKNILIALLSLPLVLLTHFWYGIKFLQGFLFYRSNLIQNRI